MKKQIPMFLAAVTLSGVTQAKVDLTTVPTRETVQLTIYNSADMTFVREQRALTLKEGINRLQFSWANTLIDPTSLEMTPKGNADQIDIQELVYPPRTKNLGLWNIRSGISGKAPVEISYLTSGLSWRAFYMGTLTPDETQLRLQGYVRVTNNSGEDYENAQTRLIVGQVHLLDEIARLAQQPYPYGRPGPFSGGIGRMGSVSVGFADSVNGERKKLSVKMIDEPKEITKEGLSEYFLYTIEGTETIPTTWSKRLPSFDTDHIPVVNLYKFEQERYGEQVRRFLSFKNDAHHKLGDTPIPGGGMQVYGKANAAGSLAYVGASSFQYIPVDEKVELDLGSVQNVLVEPKLMKQATDRIRYNTDGNIIGWNEIRDFQIEVRNTRSMPIKVEITRNTGTPYWEMTQAGDYGKFEKYSLNSVRFTLELPAESKKIFTYKLTTSHGVNKD